MEFRRRDITKRHPWANLTGPYNASHASGTLMYSIVSQNRVAELRVAMNQVVRLGGLLIRQGVLAAVLFAPCVLSPGLLGQQQPTQDQSVPDAPTPQQNDGLGRITSGM